MTSAAIRVLSVDLPAASTSLKVPPEFLQRHVEYTFEVLATEAGGNQTLTSASFIVK